MALEVAESKSRPLMAEHGGERWEMTRTEDGTKLAKKDDVQVDNVNLNIEDNSPPKGGNKLSYLTDRLRTQYPEVFAALERGCQRASSMKLSIQPWRKP